MQCSGCASITLPQSAAGTTCTSTMETPFTPLWLLCSGEQSGRAVSEVGRENMEMTQVAFGTASEKKAATELHLCSQMAPRRKTMGLVITVVPRAISERKKKKNEITHISLECWFCFWSFVAYFPFFFFLFSTIYKRVGGTLSFDRNSLKNTNTTIIYKPPTIYSAPLRLISCWEFSCSQDIKDYIPTDEEKKYLAFEHTEPRLVWDYYLQ